MHTTRAMARLRLLRLRLLHQMLITNMVTPVANGCSSRRSPMPVQVLVLVLVLVLVAICMGIHCRIP